MLHFSSVSSLVTHPFPEELFLVEPFMPSGGICMLWGRRGAGKTQLALTLSRSIIHGTPFLGAFPTTQGTVGLIQVDLPYRVAQDRVEKFHKVIDPAHDGSMHFWLKDRPVDVVEAVAKGEAWTKQVAAVKPTLLIVDTLHKTHAMNENESATPTVVYRAWREIVGEGPTILFLHHQRKSFEGSDPEEDFRGSGAWLDDIDLGIKINKASGSQKRIFSFPRVRTCEEIDTMLLSFNDQSLMLEIDNPVEAEMWRMVEKGVPKADIKADVTDARKWKHPISIRTFYRWLENYKEGEDGVWRMVTQKAP